jgi:hypothetical protein
LFEKLDGLNAIECVDDVGRDDGQVCNAFLEFE